MEKSQIKTRDLASLIATLFAIFINMFISAQVYALFQDSLINAFIYNVMEAFGSVAMGVISDKFCRKKTSVLSHSIGLALLVFFFFNQHYLILIFLMGFFYNPMPTLRAGLIDNFPHYSRIHLLMLSFIVQFLPWMLYDTYVATGSEKMLQIGIGFLALSLLASIFFFYDKRDKKYAEKNRLRLKAAIHPSSRRRLFYTVGAFFCIQFVFFVADNLFENIDDASAFYSVMSSATILCVILALTFKDISHVSVLRVNYGILSALSFIPILALYIFGIPSFDSSFMIIMLAGFGAFTLPFVYDVTINSLNANYRGSGCGVLDFAYNASALFNASFIVFLNMNKMLTYLIISLGLCLALYLQTHAEKHKMTAQS